MSRNCGALVRLFSWTETRGYRFSNTSGLLAFVALQSVRRPSKLSAAPMSAPYSPLAGSFVLETVELVAAECACSTHSAGNSVTPAVCVGSDALRCLISFPGAEGLVGTAGWLAVAMELVRSSKCLSSLAMRAASRSRSAAIRRASYARSGGGLGLSASTNLCEPFSENPAATAIARANTEAAPPGRQAPQRAYGEWRLESLFALATGRRSCGCHIADPANQ
jgi:hypothetical protein